MACAKVLFSDRANVSSVLMMLIDMVVGVFEVVIIRMNRKPNDKDYCT